MTTAQLEVTGLSCRRGGRPVFGNLSFSLAPGELLTLTGRNGSGKTTLLRALGLLVAADAGSIRWQGNDVARDRDGWRRCFAWLGHLDGLKGRPDRRGESRERLPAARGAGDRIDSSLVALDLGSLADRAVRTLSAGQRRRAALARVLATAAPLWLLDEPLNALDATSQAALRWRSLGILPRWPRNRRHPRADRRPETSARSSGEKNDR
jgi:heme exporter protein A